MKIPRPPRPRRPDTIGLIVVMSAVVVVTLTENDHPLPTLIVVAAVILAWLGIRAAKKWWKSGNEDFRKIMNEELR